MGLLLTAFARKGFWKLVWHSLKSQKVMQAVLFGIFFAQPIHLLLNYALKFVWLQDWCSTSQAIFLTCFMRRALWSDVLHYSCRLYCFKHTIWSKSEHWVRASKNQCPVKRAKFTGLWAGKLHLLTMAYDHDYDLLQVLLEVHCDFLSALSWSTQPSRGTRLIWKARASESRWSTTSCILSAILRCSSAPYGQADWWLCWMGLCLCSS